MATKTLRELLDATSYEDFDQEDIENLVAVKQEMAANRALLEASVRGAAEDAAAYAASTAATKNQYNQEFDNVRAISPALIDTSVADHLVAITVTRKTWPVS